MAAGLSGGTALIFSINFDGTGDETYGIIQSATIRNATERAEAKGPDGHTVSVQEYDDKKELSLNYLQKSAGSGDPAIGSTFTFEGDTWYINDVSEGEVVDGFKTVDVSATNYPHLGV